MTLVAGWPSWYALCCVDVLDCGLEPAPRSCRASCAGPLSFRDELDGFLDVEVDDEDEEAVDVDSSLVCFNLRIFVLHTTQVSGSVRVVTATWMVLMKHLRHTTLCPQG
jgi:hypothetical protein